MQIDREGRESNSVQTVRQTDGQSHLPNGVMKLEEYTKKGQNIGNSILQKFASLELRHTYAWQSS